MRFKGQNTGENKVNLFERKKEYPLPVRMRPDRLEDLVGQEEITGDTSLLARAIRSDKLFSVILFGPPGCGKTALAHIISQETNAHFEKMNAVTAGIPEIRKLVAEAKHRWDLNGKRTIAFIDEIHRFNKVQQDALLPDVEDGTITLIGATTHNPFFSVIPALVSRSQVFELKELKAEALKALIKRALSDKEKGLGDLKIRIDDDAADFIANTANGDARRALNALEIGALTTPPEKKGVIHITLETAKESIQKRSLVYDKDEDGHYDTISAFIKSMRGSDPDAALYWLAKMIYAGEDPRFIARRFVIFASEDVGNADPLALVVANSAMQAVETIGMPEGRIILAQAVTYLATAPKSNASYMGVEAALADIKENKTQEVPLHLKNANYKGEKEMGKGKGYKYPHSFGGYVEQEYMPEKKIYYKPKDIGFEKKIRERMERLDEKK
jgi:putative ATPase